MSELKLAAWLALASLVLLGATGRLGFVTEEFSSAGRRITATVLLLAVLTACTFHPPIAAEAGRTLDPNDLWFPGLFLGHFLLAAFLIAWWLLARPVPLRTFLRLEGLSGADVLYGLRLGFAGWIVTLAGSAAIGTLASASGALDTSGTLPPIVEWLAALPVWQKLAVIGAAMTVEEAFFRAFLQTRIGWIPSSLLFALGHASYGMPMLMVGVFLISLVIGWSLRQTGRLLPCVVAHGFFDAIQLLIVLPWAVRMIGGPGT
jgi:membrane protease YdiL (CAAX protease family)